MKKRSIAIISLPVLFFLPVWLLGSGLSHPAFSKIGLPPPGHETENIIFKGVHGWFIPGKMNKACVLLMHGIRGNRKSMLNRSLFLQKSGYSSFNIDLQAHGETPGEAITFGFKEAESAHTAVAFLRQQKHCSKVISIGNSLGGAASLLGSEPIDVDGYILEAVYPTIEAAVKNRLKILFGDFGGIIAPFLYEQIPARLDIDLKALRPIDAIKKVKSPVMIMAGTNDRRTTLKESKMLYNNIPTRKVFHPVEGAHHTDFYKFNANAYKTAVLQFIANYVEHPPKG